jgi:predicted transcriptional regulator
MFADESPKSAGRRSKLEIACDIISVISKGTEKPTRIMQLANVTWDDLIMYLEALIRNHLVQRSVEGKRVTYAVTESGRSLLQHYTALRKEAAPLNLEALAKESIKAPMQNPRLGNQESELYARIERSVKAEGSKVLSAKVSGKSGAVHTLGIVAEQSDGSKHGYVILGHVDETQVVKLFVTQLDTELSIHAYYHGDLRPKVAELARAYSLDLLPWDTSKAAQ